MMAKVDLDGYVTVAERVTAFYERYPDGSIQTDLLELTDSRVVVRASAFRHPEDPRPGVGHAAMTIPGSTSFTRGSELENTESSAWGRALAALGFETKRGIASADEIRSKARDEGEHRLEARPVRNQTPFGPLPTAATPVPNRTGGLGIPEDLALGDALEIIRGNGIEPKAVSNKGRELYGEWQLKAMNGSQRAHVVEELLRDRGLTMEIPADDEAVTE